MGSDRDLLEIVKSYKWTLILALCGFLLAVCFISYGFFKTLLILLLVAVGVFGGLQLDKKFSRNSKSEDDYNND